MKRTAMLVVAAVLGLASLSACSTPAPAPDRAVAICVDPGNPNDPNDDIRIDDDRCPIGDGVVPGYRYTWAYYPYVHTASYVDVPYVGYAVPRVYVTQRPAKVTTLNIVRGSLPSRPPAGQANTSTARVTTPDAAKRAPTPGITRGGLGSTSVGAVQKATPTPLAPPVAKRPIGSMARPPAKSGKK